MSDWNFCNKGKGKKVHVKVCKLCDEKGCEVKKTIGVVRIAKRKPKEEEDKWK